MSLYANFYCTYCEENHMKPNVNFIKFINCVKKAYKRCI